MGVNSHIYLEKDVRVRDVADVMGILAGLKPCKTTFTTGDGWYTQVKGVKVETTTFPEMCTILLDGNMVDGEVFHYVNYFFESLFGNYRLLYPKATPFWIAIGVGLCKFFGGKIDYADCDEGNINARWKKPRKSNCPEKDKAWYVFQEEKFNVKPITEKDMIKANKWAGYKNIKYERIA